MNNEFIISGELTPLSWGIIGFVLLFAAQLLLCLKAKRKAVKCIPLYLIGCALLYGIATYTGLLGSYSAGDISGNEPAGVLIVVFTLSLSLGDLLAWVVYLIRWLVLRKRA